MNRHAGIRDELIAMGSPLADFPLQVPFVIPKGYFQDLPKQLLSSKLSAEAKEPDTASFPKDLVFQTPEAYFYDLAERLTDTAATADFTGEKKIPFTVPDGYFTTLPAQLLAATKAAAANPHTTKFIPLASPWRKWFIAAAAAVLLLSLSLGTYHYYDAQTPDAIAARQLAQLAPDSISEYVALHLDDFDNAILENLFDSPAASKNTQLPSLNDQDIRQYLEENGDQIPAETHAPKDL
ncbi:MAG: hypothetical protein JST06_04305 [Bacteroidetes bacterium]|nr:hypothetical protein [Bacteroidota bacterium]MBS1628959.1 hypothetical protein [Bacteroidota bacterium]